MTVNNGIKAIYNETIKSCLRDRKNNQEKMVFLKKGLDTASKYGRSESVEAYEDHLKKVKSTGMLASKGYLANSKIISLASEINYLSNKGSLYFSEEKLERLKKSGIKNEIVKKAIRSLNGVKEASLFTRSDFLKRGDGLNFSRSSMSSRNSYPRSRIIRIDSLNNSLDSNISASITQTADTSFLSVGQLSTKSTSSIRRVGGRIVPVVNLSSLTNDLSTLSRTCRNLENPKNLAIAERQLKKLAEDFEKYENRPDKNSDAKRINTLFERISDFEKQIKERKDEEKTNSIKLTRKKSELEFFQEKAYHKKTQDPEERKMIREAISHRYHSHSSRLTARDLKGSRRSMARA